MYRLFLLLLVAIGCALGLHWGMPWWFPVPVALVAAGLLPVWRRGGFWFSLLAGIMVWGIFSGYHHISSAGRMGDRLAVTFGVASGWVLVALTAFWGGLTAGLGGWVGASLRIALRGGKR